MARIVDIEVGERRREDLGDIAGLAESLKKYGLLHPIIVDEELNLIAGQRRLEAAKLLGWTDIDVRYKTDLTEKEKREIELEENLRRKDLTAYERSKVIVERVKIAREIAKEEAKTCGESLQVSRPVRGPARTPGSARDIEERTGIPTKTATEAEQHVATAETYPFMQKPDWKQYHVLEAKEAIEKIPEEERPILAEMVSEPFIQPKTAIKLLNNAANMNPKERNEVCRLYQSEDYRDKAQAKSKVAELPPEPDPRLFFMDDAIKAVKHCIVNFPNDPLNPDLQETIKRLQEHKKQIREASKNREKRYEQARAN